ncbi:MAG: insulinase family protein [Bryobacterales bacterium]|nr:insulinase family protein [Bryobacterales bacterium]
MRRALFWAAIALPLTAQVKIPQFSRQTLPNGVTLLLSAKRDVPLITLRAVIRGGAEAEPPGSAGLANLTAELLRRGAGPRNSEQFAQALDFIGAEFKTSADNQSTVVSIEFLSKDADRALELFSDALTKPAFPEGEFVKARDERVAAAKALKDEPDRIVSLYARAFFFGSGHPYGRPADELSYAALTRQQVNDYHRSLYVGRNLFLVAVGDFEPAQMSKRLAERFSPLPPGSPYAWKSAANPVFNGPRLLLVDKPDATQTYFAIQQPGIHRSHPDRVVLLLVNTLFGGRFTSMLNDELRVNSGLTYGASSRFQTDRLTGAFSMVTFTKTDTTAKTIDLALDVLRRLRDKGITAEQLQSAKAYVKGVFPTENLETSDQLAQVLGDLELFTLNRGEIDDLFSRIDSITPEQATAAARKYFRAENLQFTLIGNAAQIREAVARYAPTTKTVPISAPGIRPDK